MLLALTSVMALLLVAMGKTRAWSELFAMYILWHRLFCDITYIGYSDPYARSEARASFAIE